MKKIITLILAVCLVLAMVPAVAEEAPFELNVCVASEPETTDPGLANSVDAALIHEAAIGKIAGEQLVKLMTLGLTEQEAEEQIINGFLR